MRICTLCGILILTMDYGRIFEVLNRAGVRYLVAGGVALNLHGIPRMTADLDLVVDLSTGNLKRMLLAAGDLGLKPRLPVKPEDLLDPAKRQSWIRERNLLAFTFVDPKDPTTEIDVLLDIPFDFHAAYGRRKPVPLPQGDVPVLSREDLVLMKGKSNREQDQADLRALKALEKFEANSNG